MAECRGEDPHAHRRQKNADRSGSQSAHAQALAIKAKNPVR
jgi:hypothetical protein